MKKQIEDTGLEKVTGGIIFEHDFCGEKHYEVYDEKKGFLGDFSNLKEAHKRADEEGISKEIVDANTYEGSYQYLSAGALHYDPPGPPPGPPKTPIRSG